MDAQALAALEQAIEPYRRRGFIVTSQSEGAITLSPPPAKFSYLLFFLALIAFWPAAVIYLVYFNSRKNRQVCVRLTSDGRVEETGYTLDALAKEGGGGWQILLITAAIALLFLLMLLLLGYRPW